jgi:hypothetical protein
MSKPHGLYFRLSGALGFASKILISQQMCFVNIDNLTKILPVFCQYSANDFYASL